MLEIFIPGRKGIFDDSRGEFFDIKDTKIQLEHSLISLRKWEGKWHVPFLSTELSFEQVIDYIRFMTLNSTGIDPLSYYLIPEDSLKSISEYIRDPMTATTFSDEKVKMGYSRRAGEIVTAEIIYYWMISLNIPVSFEKWHLNQLLALIKTVSTKNDEANPNSTGKIRKDPRVAALERDRINNERRLKYRTKG